MDALKQGRGRAGAGGLAASRAACACGAPPAAAGGRRPRRRRECRTRPAPALPAPAGRRRPHPPAARRALGHGIASPASQAGGRPRGTRPRISSARPPNQIKSEQKSSPGRGSRRRAPSRAWRRTGSGARAHRLQRHVDHHRRPGRGAPGSAGPRRRRTRLPSIRFWSGCTSPPGPTGRRSREAPRCVCATQVDDRLRRRARSGR